MQCFIVDAFTHGKLAGNAAAVVILPERKAPRWMQAVAAEFQLSETAFLYQPELGSDTWELRWFTPEAEVDLCGHATLASAHVIWRHLGENAGTLMFDTRSGSLEAVREEFDQTQGITLNFPASSLSPLEFAAPPKEKLQLQPIDWRQAGDDLLLVLANTAAVRDYRPDMETVAKLPWRGLIITARNEGGELDFVSRFFVPKLGVPEDPVTGAIHCCLAPYWGEQLGKTRMVAEQCSARGGRLYLQLNGDRVHLSGEARTFLEGRLLQ